MREELGADVVGVGGEGGAHVSVCGGGWVSRAGGRGGREGERRRWRPKRQAIPICTRSAPLTHSSPSLPSSLPPSFCRQECRGGDHSRGCHHFPSRCDQSGPRLLGRGREGGREGRRKEGCDLCVRVCVCVSSHFSRCGCFAIVVGRGRGRQGGKEGGREVQVKGM